VSERGDRSVALGADGDEEDQQRQGEPG